MKKYIMKFEEQKKSLFENVFIKILSCLVISFSEKH